MRSCGSLPEPAEPFIHLTKRLVENFRLRPYEGLHTDITPHLTVAQTNPRDGGHVAELVAAQLPISGVADRVQLLVGGHQTHWTLRHEYGLGAGKR
jgi:hypothetical protein